MNRCGRWEIRIADRMPTCLGGLTRDRAMAPHQEELLTVDPDNENRYYFTMESKTSPSIESKTASQASDGNRSVPRVSSRELMRRQSELIIEHDGRDSTACASLTAES